MKAILHEWKPLFYRLAKNIRTGLRLWQDFRWFRPGSLLAGRYVILHKLGTGSYGVTYLCRDTFTGRSCVLKRVHPLRGGRARAERIYTEETSILRHLRHPGLPALYKRFQYGEHLCFTMEYMAGKSLDELLFHEHRTFTEKESLQFILKLLSIVEYMHSVGIVHRDISIANVLVDGEMVRLIDVGLASELRSAGKETWGTFELDPDDPSEKIVRRRIHVTSDFEAIGHLLLFLLYSSFKEKEQGHGGADRGWEDELSLHPHTKRLLRRLLLTEQPYSEVEEIRKDLERLLFHLS